MSDAPVRAKTLSTRLIQLTALVFVAVLLWLVTRYTPEIGALREQRSTVLALGFLLLAGTLMSELLETIGLPHLTGYILAGMIGGPYIGHWIDHKTVEQLNPVNTLALCLIALGGGAELKMSMVRTVARSLAWATLCQSTIVWVVASLAFLALTHFMPFTAGFSLMQLAGVALLWGVIAITRSPSAVLGILSQTRAKGPLATFSLAFVMLSDVVVVTLLAGALVIARPLIVGYGGISMSDFSVLGHELLGSVAVGTTLGLVLAIYLRLIGRQLLLVLLAIGFSMTEALHYIQVEPLLTFLTAGFVVQNATRQGDALLHEVENISSTVFVVFFATAGAHLDIPLLRTLWPIALALCGVRVAATVLASKVSSRLANDAAVVKRYGFTPLVSQAGFALGVGAVIARTIPQLAGAFQSLIIATVAINELVGPITLKFAFDKSGESDSGAEATRVSAHDPI